MALLFVPPVRNTLPRTVAGHHPGNSLMRFFAPGARGVNVFIINGVVTENDPGPNAGATVFHGGHEHLVTTTQAALLTAAGYTVTTVADPVVFPGFDGTTDFPVGPDSSGPGFILTDGYGGFIYGGGIDIPYGGEVPLVPGTPPAPNPGVPSDPGQIIGFFTYGTDLYGGGFYGGDMDGGRV